MQDGRRRTRVGRLDEDAPRGFGRRVEVIIQKPLRGRAVDRCGEEHAVGGEAFGIIAHQELAWCQARQRVVLDRNARRAAHRDVGVAEDLHRHVDRGAVVGRQRGVHGHGFRRHVDARAGAQRCRRLGGRNRRVAEKRHRRRVAGYAQLQRVRDRAGRIRDAHGNVARDAAAIADRDGCGTDRDAGDEDRALRLVDGDRGDGRIGGGRGDRSGRAVDPRRHGAAGLDRGRRRFDDDRRLGGRRLRGGRFGGFRER